MRLSDFHDLCWREWCRPRRGDVVSVLLTEASHEELAADVLAPPEAVVSEVVNPVTRTAVKVRVRPGGDRDSARVAVMGGTYRQTWWPAGT